MSKNLLTRVPERVPNRYKMGGPLTVSGSTMMAQASCGPQGQMSHGAVEKGLPKGRDPSTRASASLRFALASLRMTEIGAGDAKAYQGL